MGQTNTKVDGKSIMYVGEGNSYYLQQVKFYQAQGRSYKVVGAQAKNPKIDVMQHTSLRHPNLVETLTYDSDFKEIWHTQYGMTFYFDYLDVSLYDICQKRRSYNQRFKLAEVERLMTDLLLLLQYFEQTRTVAHWGLSTNSIFYDKNEKKMKVYNHEMLFGKMASYFNILQKKKEYATPEIQHVIDQGVIKYQRGNFPTATQYGEEYLTNYRNKSDIYQLGLTLLEVTTYLSSYSVYDIQQNKINHDEINSRLSQIGQYYNKDLQTKIAQMLIIDPQERLSATQLLAFKMPNLTQNALRQLPQQRNGGRSMSISRASVGEVLPKSRVIVPLSRSLSTQQVPGYRSLPYSKQLPHSRLVQGSRIMTQPPSAAKNRMSRQSSNKVLQMESRLNNLISRSQTVTGQI